MLCHNIYKFALLKFYKLHNVYIHRLSRIYLSIVNLRFTSFSIGRSRTYNNTGYEPGNQPLINYTLQQRTNKHYFERRTRLYHFADFPHFVLGSPPAVLPPFGWSTAFIAQPRTVGLIPNQRFAPALPCLRNLWEPLLHEPNEHVALDGNSTTRFDGKRITPTPSSQLNNTPQLPAARQ